MMRKGLVNRRVRVHVQLAGGNAAAGEEREWIPPVSTVNEACDDRGSGMYGPGSMCRRARHSRCNINAVGKASMTRTGVTAGAQFKLSEQPTKSKHGHEVIERAV